MKKILATLIGLVVLAAATPAVAASSHRHPGWQRNSHNRHYRPPVTTCSWVMLNQLGSVPHLICVTR